MSDTNRVILEGNLTDNLDLQTGSSGTVYARAALAVNKSRRDSNGNWENEPHFFNFTVFGDLAEHAAASLVKGSRVVLQGRLQQDRWETEVDGQMVKRTAVTIIADDIAPSLRWATAVVSKTKGGSSNGASSEAVEAGIAQLEEAFGSF